MVTSRIWGLIVVAAAWLGAAASASAQRLELQASAGPTWRGVQSGGHGPSFDALTLEGGVARRVARGFKLRAAVGMTMGGASEVIAIRASCIPFVGCGGGKLGTVVPGAMYHGRAGFAWTLPATERDYFFVASFVTWGVWVGIGIGALAARAWARLRPALRPLSAGVFVLSLVPLVLNFGPASRRHNPDATLAADFATNLLNSVPPYAILFTYGDNDTFPLWWAQEVQGVRRDVTIVCLALAETPWYMRQLRDNPVRPFDESTAPAIWQGRSPVMPDWPLHTMSDADIEAAIPQLIADEVDIAYGPYRVRVPAHTPFYGKDFVTVRILQQNFGRRPIAWSLTAGSEYHGLDLLMVQRGLTVWVEQEVPDSADTNLDFSAGYGAPVDQAVTERLLTETYRYAELLERGPVAMEPTARSIASTLAVPFTQLASAAELRGDLAAMVRWLEPAYRLSNNPRLASALDSARARLPSAGR
jgi:hypothetical protein